MNNQGIDHEDMLSVIERAYARAYETLSELHVCKVQIRSPMTAQASAKDLAVRSKVKASFNRIRGRVRQATGWRKNRGFDKGQGKSVTER
jgi:hypothetical protein